MYYAILFFIPVLLVAAIVKLYFKWEYSWGEFIAQSAGTLVVFVALFALAGNTQTRDVKMLNGSVTSTNPVKASCPIGWRSYRDNHCTEYRTRQVYSHTTCTGTGSSKTCTNYYDTEYNYIYEWERRYYVESNLERTFEISRVDAQGATIPPRFAEVEVGDPVSIAVNYKNYIKGAASSLFAKDVPIEPLPIAYPSVKDYYKSNRVIFTNTETEPGLWKSWNDSFMKVNSTVGETGANAILVITDDNNTELPEALARNWHAHNINDVVTVVGRSGKEIKWVDVRSWSNNSLVNVEIENEMLNMGELDPERINTIIQTAIAENYVEKSMDDFEYLADDIMPPRWAFILALIVLLIVTPVVTLMFHKHEIF